MRFTLIPVLLLSAIGCGEPTGGGGIVVSGYAGVYQANFSGTYANTTPNRETGTYTDTATVTATDQPGGRVELVWRVGANPPGGTIVFKLIGATGTSVDGAGTAGNCFTGTLTNGNNQASCCSQCSITFLGKTFTQSQVGTYTGTTPQSVAYTGTYTGAWTGTSTN